MSLHLEFEPHSWYRGFAIRQGEYMTDWKTKNIWYAYTDDGNTYRIVERHADTLAGLKRLISEYRQHEAARLKRLYGEA